MIPFSTVASWTLLFLAASAVGSTNILKRGEPKNNDASVSAATDKCTNVYNTNTVNAGPNKEMEALLHEMEEHLHDIQVQLTDVHEEIRSLKGNKSEGRVYKKNCAELFKSGKRSSGVYTIKPDNLDPFDVFCDQSAARGGWLVFQKRLDGSVDFYRGWNDYKNGFGDLNGEFWLGLDKIRRLTSKENNRLRVELEDIEGKTAYAEYDLFAVTSEKTNYQLSLGTYSGTAGDSLSAHRGQPFSTKDKDNDSHSSGNCAVASKGAWWYTACHKSNLNGLYHHGQHDSGADGVSWYAWKGHNYSAKRAEMKIRPLDF